MIVVMNFLVMNSRMVLLCAGIIARPISARSPQANGIIECVHAIMAQIIRACLKRHPPESEEDKQRYN